MECVVYLFCFILITQTIWVNYEKKRMQKMIKNVTEQLDDIKKGQGNRYAQIKTTNQDVNSLINSINSFLEMQYEHETEYKKRNQLAMQAFLLVTAMEPSDQTMVLQEQNSAKS